MTSSIDTLLFGIFPYAALAVAITGCMWRIRRAPLTWKTGSSQLLESRWLHAGSVMFHAGMLALMMGHVFGLLTPHHLYEAFGLTTPVKQKTEIVIGLLVTPFAAFGCAILIWRRLVDPRVRANSSIGDVVLLGALLSQLLLGFLTIPLSMHHLDGSMMLKLTGYVQGLAVLDPDASRLLVGVPGIYRLHMLVGFVFVLALPFTRLVHVLSGLFVARYLLRPWQVVRKGAWRNR